jgi:hypothetical protein
LAGNFPKAQRLASRAGRVTAVGAGTVDVQMPDGARLRGVTLAGGAKVGQAVIVQFVDGGPTLATGTGAAAGNGAGGGLILVEGGGGGGAVIGAPSPHELSSAHHSGTLADAQAPQFLKLDGSRQMTGDLDLGGQSITDVNLVDGVDLPAHVANASAHHAPITLAPDITSILDLSGQAIGLDAQAVNIVLAGPATGAAADPTFRALVPDDIPSLTAAKISDFAEVAQDAAWGIVANSTSIGWTYNDAENSLSAAVLPAGVDHNSLANLATGDVHTQYVHKDTARTITAVHTFNPASPGAPFILGANAASQLVTGLNADKLDGLDEASFVRIDVARTIAAVHTFNPASPGAPFILGANALTQKVVGLNADLLDGYDPTTTNAGDTIVRRDASGNIVAQNATLRHVLPEATDTYDIGSSTVLWRKGWLSELDAIVFAENTVQIIGGWFMIPKRGGVLPASIITSTVNIDWGQAMNAGEFILLRSAGQVEYMSINSLVSGTTYLTNRNWDGSGLNNWPAGTPFVVLGVSGDGRIELNASATPRISLIRQGATYNAQTELVRIGDLGALGPYSAETWGIGMGEYAAGKTSLFVDQVNGIRIYNGTDIVGQWAADGTIKLRSSNQDRIVLSGAGVLTINDSGGAAVITLDASAGAEITKKLSMPGANSAIAIGATPPTSPTAGTGLWLDRTGLFSLAAGAFQVKIDATDGKLYAGNGGSVLDAMGLNNDYGAGVWFRLNAANIGRIHHTTNSSGSAKEIRLERADLGADLLGTDLKSVTQVVTQDDFITFHTVFASASEKAVNAGTAYEFVYSLKISPTLPSALGYIVEVNYYNSSHAYISQDLISVNNPPASQFANYRGTFTTPALCAYATITFTAVDLGYGGSYTGTISLKDGAFRLYTAKSELVLGEAAVYLNASSGLILGADVQVYRSAANVLRTPDSLTVDAGLNVGSASAAGTGDIKASGSVRQSTALGARVYNSGAITLTTGTLTALTFDSERFDTDAIHSTASNTSRLTCTTEGVYLISGTVRFASNATGNRRVLIRLGGSTYLADNTQAAVNGLATTITISTIYQLAATNYVELVALQSSGGDLAVESTASITPEFAMVRVA